MERVKKQGIIDYSEPDINESQRVFGVTADGSRIYASDYDQNIDKNFIKSDEFTVSYHGLVRYFEDSMAQFQPRLYTHVAISTEELSPRVAHKIVEGSYIQKRAVADSLKDQLGPTEAEHTLGYGVVASFLKKQSSEEIATLHEHKLGVARAIGDTALRAGLTDFLINEISRERGMFIAGGGLGENDLVEILSRPDVVSTYASRGNVINSAIIFADSPSVFPWFNEERITQIAEKSGQTYDDVHLAFLAFTSPEKREKHVASALFDMAIEEVVGGREKMTLCIECSPRSIVYVPFMIAKHFKKSWDLQNIVVERAKAVIYPKDRS